MCACQKRGEPDLKQMKCKLKRARRETAEIRSTGPAPTSEQTRSDVGRNAILLRRGSCGAPRPFPLLPLPTWKWRASASLENSGSGERPSREILSRVTANERERGSVSFLERRAREEEEESIDVTGEDKGRRRKLACKNFEPIIASRFEKSKCCIVDCL